MTVTTLSMPGRTLFEFEHDFYRESFRHFIADEVAPYYDAWEAAQIVPRELFTKMANEIMKELIGKSMGL